MVIKGIAKGDKDLRHFTFDDSDYVVRGGVYYYKVNYGKNALEGEYGEDEIGYVECTKVMPLGGKKPKPIPELEAKKAEPAVGQVSQQEEVQEPKKRGRKPKVEKIEPGTDVISVSTSGEPGTYEYLVNEIKADHIEEFQDKLNRKGDEGWELCGFDTNRHSLFGDIHIIAVFKRKRG